MAVVSRNPREHWLKPLFSKNEVAKSGYIISGFIASDEERYANMMNTLRSFNIPTAS